MKGVTRTQLGLGVSYGFIYVKCLIVCLSIELLQDYSCERQSHSLSPSPTRGFLKGALV